MIGMISSKQRRNSSSLEKSNRTLRNTVLGSVETIKRTTGHTILHAPGRISKGMYQDLNYEKGSWGVRRITLYHKVLVFIP